MLSALQPVRQELAPFEGRFAATWRVAAVCALTSLVFMVYQIPLVAIACYLVLFVMKPDPAESLLMAMGIAVLVSIVVVLMLFVTQAVIDHPVWRMAVLAGGSFLFLYIGAASRLGPAGSIIALVVGFIMTLVGQAPFGEIATRGLLYAWLMALVPMGVIVAFSAVAGRSPARLLRAELARRLHVLAQALNEPAGPGRQAVLEALRQGNGRLRSYRQAVTLFHLAPAAETRALTAAIDRSYAALVAGECWLRNHGANEDEGRAVPAAVVSQLAQRAGELAEAVQQGRLGRKTAPGAPNPQAGGNAALDALGRHLDALTQPLPPDKNAVKEGFFFPDALHNPAYTRFALKTTFAAVVCYMVYTLLDWQDIHTAMITCYVAALATTGETLHKLTLRIAGALVGAAMGIASIIFLMPLMTSIGQLMLLVFAGSLVAAWVASGSERSAYAGVQIGLAFLLTVLQGFGPDVQLSVAYDRIIGILLGNAVLYVVFTRAWPVSAFSVLQQRLATVVDQLQASFDGPSAGFSSRRLEAAFATLEQARDQLAFLHFEPSRVRPADAVLSESRAVLARLEALCLECAAVFLADADTPGGAESPVERPARWNEQVVQLRQQLPGVTS